MKYITARQAAAKWEVDVRRVQAYCAEERVGLIWLLRDFEAVLDLVDKYNIVLITRDEKPDIVAMGVHYYLERFGCFLPKEEYKQLKAMDRVCEQSSTVDNERDSPSADGQPTDHSAQ